MTDKEKEKEEARAMVRRVYSTPDGKRVLTALLLDLGYFGQAESPGDVALRNFAAFYLKERVGFTKATDAVSVVDLMLTLAK